MIRDLIAAQIEGGRKPLGAFRSKHVKNKPPTHPPTLLFTRPAPLFLSGGSHDISLHPTRTHTPVFPIPKVGKEV